MDAQPDHGWAAESMGRCARLCTRRLKGSTMPDEQPNIPSEGEQRDAAAPEPVSDEPTSQGSSHWWDRLLNKRTPSEATDEGGEQSQPGSGASQRVSLTQE